MTEVQGDRDFFAFFLLKPGSRKPAWPLVMELSPGAQPPQPLWLQSHTQAAGGDPSGPWETLGWVKQGPTSDRKQQEAGTPGRCSFPPVGPLPCPAESRGEASLLPALCVSCPSLLSITQSCIEFHTGEPPTPSPERGSPLILQKRFPQAPVSPATETSFHQQLLSHPL